MPRPHDSPAGSNPSVRNIKVETLSDSWYTLRRATFEQRQRDGHWKTTQREAYDRGNGVTALLHDPAWSKVLLVRQYRLPTHLNDNPNGMLLEAPAGLLDEGEDAETALRRELEEEVGHKVSTLQRLFRLYMSPGSVTEHLTFFVGTYDRTTRSGRGGGVKDEDEQLEIVELALDEALKMVQDGSIRDAKTMLLLLWAQGNRPEIISPLNQDQHPS